MDLDLHIFFNDAMFKHFKDNYRAEICFHLTFKNE